MLTSLYTGTAGIKANSKALGTVGSNIANVATVGYKASRSSFANVLNESMAIGTVGEEELWTQGSLEQTEISTDLSIVGDGMFKLRDDTGAMFYSRDGAFHFDDEGKLVNTSGLSVQGFGVNSRGQLEGARDIVVNAINSAPSATEEIAINFNLDGEFTAGTAVVDCSDNLSSINYTSLIPGEDGNGMSISYTKTPGGGNMEVSASGNAITVSIGDSLSTAAQVAASVNAFFEGASRIEVGSDDAGVLYVADTPGTSGDDIEIVYVDPAGVGALSVAVAGDVITVTLAHDGTDITSSAQEVAQAINAHATAGTMVTSYPSGDGSGVVSATAAVALDSGDDTSLMSHQLEGVATATLGSSSSSVLFAADRAGSAGNSISVVYVDPAVTGALSVAVVGDVITVTLADDGTDITSSAEDVADAINNNAEAAAKITAYAGGTGTITAAGTAALEGGNTSPHTCLIKAEAGGNGSGLVEARDPIVVSGGTEPADFSTTTTVYDSLGNPVDLVVDFIFDPVESYNADEGLVEEIAQWTWTARSSEGVANAHGTLRFDSTGQLDRINSKWDIDPMTDPPNPQNTLRDDGNPTFGISNLTSGATDINLVWDLTNSTLITGFSADSEIRSQIQDGYAPGTLRDISVDENGVVRGSFSNGKSQALYQIGVTMFSNKNGLSSQGSNVFAETVNSGTGLFGTASTGGRGRISPGSLELSNVDLAEEFVRMITIQRAYQANSKVITTSAEVLQELVNMKR